MSLLKTILILMLPQLALGQLSEIINKMSWEDLVAVVDDYQNKELFAKSLPYAMRMKDLAKTRYDKKNSHYALVLRKTAKASEAVGDWKLTKEINSELVPIAAALHGKKSAHYAFALVNWANIEAKLGNYKQSEKLCWKVKNTKIQNPINQKYFPLQYFNRSIDKIKDDNKRKGAYQEYLEAKIILVTNLITLSSNYKAMGDKKAYELANQSALEETAKMVNYVLKNSYDVIPQAVILDIRKLLSVFDDFENYQKGEQLYLETMAITRGSELYQPLALNLASIYTKIGEFTGAKMIYAKLLKDAEAQYGAESIPFALALADLATFYMKIEDSSEAAKFYLKAKGIVLRLEGRNSQIYLDINKKLKNVYRSSQKRNE